MKIHFGKLNYYHIIIVIVPIIVQVQKYVINATEINNAFYNGFVDYLGMTLCGIIHLIIICCTKTKNQKEYEKSEKKNNLELNELDKQSKDSNQLGKAINIYQDIELKTLKKKKVERRNKFLLVLLISVLQISGTLIKNLFKGNINGQLLKNISIFSIALYLIIFSMIFLRLKLYLHQYFSIGLLSLCIIVFIIESLIYKDNISFVDVLKSFFYFCIYELFYCLANVIGKKYLNMYMDGVYLFLFKIGIIQASVFLIYDIIAYSYGFENHGIIDTIKNKILYMKSYFIYYLV